MSLNKPLDLSKVFGGTKEVKVNPGILGEVWMKQSYTGVLVEGGLRKGGVGPIWRWVRAMAMVCEYPNVEVSKFEAGRALAK